MERDHGQCLLTDKLRRHPAQEVFSHRTEPTDVEPRERHHQHDHERPDDPEGFRAQTAGDECDIRVVAADVIGVLLAVGELAEEGVAGPCGAVTECLCIRGLVCRIVRHVVCGRVVVRRLLNLVEPIEDGLRFRLCCPPRWPHWRTASPRPR